MATSPSLSVRPSASEHPTPETSPYRPTHRSNPSTQSPTSPSSPGASPSAARSLNLDHLNTVFVAVGFPRRDTNKIRLALENTDTLLWYEYEKTKRPVAFARATGDGVFNAIIWDVVVDPNRPSHNAICCAFSFIAYHLTT
ncbi:hypothetical protein RJ640_012323 [Escallonia rubra]|uniref:Uncharacterized protein n=1 Tax=Escallonia rubra TaxID=112253 RepID=A0AA88QU12_9ASTE|nr:hypothetical protein RJ640_012323 [Escallonia rubra]